MGATATLPPARQPLRTGPGEQRVVLRGVPWELYETLVHALGEQHVRLTYNRGDLEFMSPGSLHEQFKTRLARILADLLFMLAIPYKPAGETTWKSEAEKRGLEADECYFIDPAKVASVRVRAADWPNQIIPDLAIEIEVTSGSVNKMQVYAALGVLEVWRFDGESLRIERLRDDGTYETKSESIFLPVRPDELVKWVHLCDTLDWTEWLSRLHAWIRQDVVPKPWRGDSQ